MDSPLLSSFGTSGASALPLDPDAIAAMLRLPPPPRDPLDLHIGEITEGTPVRDAAVLVPFVVRSGQLNVLFTQRTPHLAAHAGQISFPGGRVEASDAGREDTALRETEEEIGLARRHVEVLGFLDPYVTITGFVVTPVVALVTPPFELELDSFEVADAFEVPLSFFLDRAKIGRAHV